MLEKQEGRDHFGYGRDCAVSHGRPLESSEQIESQVKSSQAVTFMGKEKMSGNTSSQGQPSRDSEKHSKRGKSKKSSREDGRRLGRRQCDWHKAKGQGSGRRW